MAPFSSFFYADVKSLNMVLSCFSSWVALIIPKCWYFMKFQRGGGYMPLGNYPHLYSWHQQCWNYFSGWFLVLEFLESSHPFSLFFSGLVTESWSPGRILWCKRPRSWEHTRFVLEASSKSFSHKQRGCCFICGSPYEKSRTLAKITKFSKISTAKVLRNINHFHQLW